MPRKPRTSWSIMRTSKLQQQNHRAESVYGCLLEWLPREKWSTQISGSIESILHWLLSCLKKKKPTFKYFQFWTVCRKKSGQLVTGSMYKEHAIKSIGLSFMSNLSEHKSLIQTARSYPSSPEVEDFIRDFQSVVPWPVASAWPGNLLDIQILGLHPRTSEYNLWGWDQLFWF